MLICENKFLKYQSKLELLRPTIVNHLGNDLKLFRKFVILTLVVSLALLIFTGFFSIRNGNTRLLWYFLAFILPFEFFLLAIYSYLDNIRSKEWSLECIQELGDFFRATITTVSMAIDAKEQTEYGNILKVRDIAMELALNHPDNKKIDIDGIAISALVHDIGKLAVPEGILNKPGGLTKAEISRMQRHANIGADILETVPFPKSVILGVRHHHERWDGTGYPSRIAGEQIPLEARILAVADTYASLRSVRPYRHAWDVSPARDLLIKESGKAYDPMIVEIFKAHFEKIEEIVSRRIVSDEKNILEDVKKNFTSGNDIAYSDPTAIFNNISFPHKEMQAEFEITRNIGKTLSLEETSSILATWIERFVPYTTCVVYRFDKKHLNIEVYHAVGKYQVQIQNMGMPVGNGISGQVAADLKPRFGINPETDFPSEKQINGLKDCLVVPLMFKDEIPGQESSINPVLIGVIALYAEEENFYTPEHLKLMTTISEHAARAVNNSIIHSETREDAFTDSLTGLPNIRFFNATIENEIHRAQRLKYPINFLMMDLDDFKMVNDVYGHKEGDSLLVEISNLLKEQFRKSDICIRYGGDEFLAILPGVGIHTTEQTMDRINAVFSDSVFRSASGDPLKIGISIGASSYPQDGTSHEVLLVTADRNMYKNKNEKKEHKKSYQVEKQPS
jgi:diguanylate cyclase (GGDEF)-like protein